MAYRICLGGRAAAHEVLLAPAVDLDALGVLRRRVEVCACRECKTARDEQARGDPGSFVLHVLLLENNRLATHRLPVCRARNVTLCAPQRRSSGRARQRALEPTNNEIESSQKRTTGEAIVGLGGFAIRFGSISARGFGFRAAQRR